MKPRAFLVMTLAAALAAPVLAPATALADSAYLAGALAELEAAAPTGTSATSGGRRPRVPRRVRGRARPVHSRGRG